MSVLAAAPYFDSNREEHSVQTADDPSLSREENPLIINCGH